MTSKEFIKNYVNCIGSSQETKEEKEDLKLMLKVLKDLERLEQLEKRNKELVNIIDELREENFKIKQIQTCIWGEQDAVRQKQIETLIKENQDLKVFVDAYANTRDELLIKNEQLEKALDLACERLNWDCPVSQDLIADLDCENRCTDDFEECCKECWKLYFLKEVLKDE